MSRSFTDQTDIFADETVLYDSWTPEKLPERETELDDLHDALAPVAARVLRHTTRSSTERQVREKPSVSHTN